MNVQQNERVDIYVYIQKIKEPLSQLKRAWKK